VKPEWRRLSVVALVALLSMAPATAQAAGVLQGTPTDIAIWEMIRASGIIAYLLLTISVFMGVAVNARALDAIMRRAWVFEAHRTVAVLALAFTTLHVLLLLVNRHVPLTIVQVLVPLAASWRAVPLALGTISLYLAAALTVSSYARSIIGQRTWRLIHYGGFAGWITALAHGITAGSDTAMPWVQYFYLSTGAAAAFLITFRLLAPSRSPHAQAPARH